jgi:hypothetical protein
MQHFHSSTRVVLKRRAANNIFHRVVAITAGDLEYLAIRLPTSSWPLATP